MGPWKRREKGLRKIFWEIIAEKFPDMRKETLTHVQESTESAIRDEGTEEHAKTHCSPTEQVKRRAKLKAAREKQHIIYKCWWFSC